MPNSETKKDKAYQVIKKAIIDGQLESAKIFSIKELAETFDVSVTPAREALVILASEGLIEPIPRIGYQVKSLSVHDALEIFHLRSLLEVEAAGIAAEKIHMVGHVMIDTLLRNLERAKESKIIGRLQEQGCLDGVLIRFFSAK